MPHVENSFQAYFASIGHPHVFEQPLRDAFFAGAKRIFEFVTNPDDIPPQVLALGLADLEREINEYVPRPPGRDGA